MLGQSAQATYILPDQLGCPMVIIQNCKDFVEDGMIGFSYAYVERKDGADDGEYQEVDLGLQESP